LFPIAELDGEQFPLGQSVITDHQRGKIVTLFIQLGALIVIIEDGLAVCIDRTHGAMRDTRDTSAFMLKIGRGAAPYPPCNFAPEFIGRMLTDVKLYPDRVEVEIDLGAAGVECTPERFGAWTRPKPPAIN
jgi:hypothetical protein